MNYLKYIPLFLGLLTSPLPAQDASLKGTTMYFAQEQIFVYYIHIGFRGKDNRDVFGKWVKHRFSSYNELEQPIPDPNPEVEVQFTGKIISGNKQEGKIEIKFSGNAPYEEITKKSGRLWAINSTKIEVPMMRYSPGEKYEGILEFEAAPSQPVAENKNSTLIVGIWLPEEGEVAHYYNLDHTYSFETEGAAFEVGKWLFEGDYLITIDEAGNKRVTHTKFISKDTRKDIPERGSPFRWNRLIN